MAIELTKEEYWQLQALINAKVPAAGNCPTCGEAGTVQMAAHLVTPVATSLAGGVSLAGANYPQAMLMCSNCGYTRYFNAMILRSQLNG